MDDLERLVLGLTEQTVGEPVSPDPHDTVDRLLRKTITPTQRRGALIPPRAPRVVETKPLRPTASVPDFAGSNGDREVDETDLAADLPDFSAQGAPVNVPNPEPRPADAQQKSPIPPVQPLDDAQFRTGGTAVSDFRSLGGADGTSSGMLSGKDAYDEGQKRLAAADQSYRAAVGEREKAEREIEELRKNPPQFDPNNPFDDPRTRIEAADANLKATRDAEAAAFKHKVDIQKNPMPTQGFWRNVDENIVQSVLGGVKDSVNAGLGVLESSTVPSKRKDLSETRKQREQRQYEEAQKLRENVMIPLVEYVEQAAKPDITQTEDLSSKLTQGATSMAMFMAGGAATRALGLGPGLGAGLTGSAMMGGQGLSEADAAAKVLADEIAAMEKRGEDTTQKKNELDHLKNYKRYISLFANAALGSLERLPIERFFRRLNEVGGKNRVAAILASSTTQTIEEAAQETGQQIGTNIIAKLLYEEGRDIFKDVVDSAKVGAILGLAMGVGGGAVRPLDRSKKLTPADVLADIEDRLARTKPRDPSETLTEIEKRLGNSTTAEPAANTASPEASNSPLPQDTEIADETLQASKPKSAITPADRSVLTQLGYTEENIADMSAAQIKAEVADAAEQGIEPEADADGDGVPDFAEGGREIKGDGTRAAPSKVEEAVDLELAAGAVNTDPSDAQKEAGNYKKGHVQYDGLNISLETPAGTKRKGKDRKGEWESPELPAHYGYVKRSKGADGDQLDVYLAKEPKTGSKIYVVDQKTPGSLFDEHKAMLGFENVQAARDAYVGSFDKDGEQRIMGITELTPEEFKGWLKTGKHGHPIARQRVGKRLDLTQKENIADIGKAGGAMVDNMYDMLWAKMEKGDVTEGGQRSNLLTSAKLVRDAGGLKTREEFIKFANEFALADDEKAPFTDRVTAYRALVQRWLPKEEAKTEEKKPDFASEGTPVEEAKTETKSEQNENVAEVEAVLAEAGVPVDSINEADIDRAAEIMEDEGLPAADALEQAVIDNALDNEIITQTDLEEVFGDDNEVQRGPVLEDGGEDQQQNDADERGSGQAQEQDGDGVQGAVEDQKIEDGGVAEAEEGQERPAGDTEGGGRSAESVEEKPKKKTKKVFAETALDKKQKVEDVGEKIGGARKDAWKDRGLLWSDVSGLTGTEQAAMITKENVWPKPDYAQMVEEGTDAVAAYLVKLVYDRIGSKPSTSYEISGEEYIERVNKVREAALKVKTTKDVREILNNALGWNDAYSIGRSSGRRSRNINPLSYDHRDVVRAEREVELGWPSREPWTRKYYVQEHEVWNTETKKIDKLGWVVRDKKTYKYIGGKDAIYKSKELAETAAKAAYENPEEQEGEENKLPKRPHLENITRSGPDYRKAKDISAEDFKDTFGFRGVEFGNYAANDERQKMVNLAFDALHDLSRVLGLPPKAISLNGTMGLAFAARGKGGFAAAHYEAGKFVINLTKLSGAGTLAHEWGHAFDHYIGELDQYRQYAGEPKSISGWYRKENSYGASRYTKLTPRLAQNAAGLMKRIFDREESKDEIAARKKSDTERAQSGYNNWNEYAEKAKKKITEDPSRSRYWRGQMDNARRNADIWQRQIDSIKDRDYSPNKVESEFYKNAKAISGANGYWARPTELFARSFEAYVFDKLAENGEISQYLVQGVEANRFGTEYKGNPYPTGADRTEINKAYDKLFRSIEAADGKLGPKTKIKGSLEPEPKEVVQEETPVPQVTAGQKGEQLEAEMEAVAEATEEFSEGKAASLTDIFFDHLRGGGSFSNIVAARQMANKGGFKEDVKQIEEALELAVVKVARDLVRENAADPAATYKALVDLYGRQPKLGTRTSTSMRDQAFSTPVPLAFIASRLAGITSETKVLEPSAGNGALLLEANPENTYANEINATRRENLKSLGFEKVFDHDAASEEFTQGGRMARFFGGVDVVIANPPFGALQDEGSSKVWDLSKIQPGYKTSQIDHVIALRALDALGSLSDEKSGRAVLLLGGVSKMASSQEARSDAYNSKAKREFYKTLYDRYNVVDHFTVAGELYERQGAGWPVDVIAIDGRGKSERKLPAADVPRVFKSWDELGGLVDGSRIASDRADARGGSREVAAGEPVGEADGRADDGGRGDDLAGADIDEPARVQPGASDGERGSGTAAAERADEEAAAGVGERGGNDLVADAERRPSELENFDDLFDSALDAEFGARPKAETPSKTEPTKKERTTKEVAKSAAENLAGSADDAMAALVKMFGGGKQVSSGLGFDPETYAKAKPLFVSAAVKFSAFKNDIGELIKRMVGELRSVYGLTREGLEAMKPYLKRFMEEVQSGVVRLGEQVKAKPTPKTQQEETSHQVEYAPKSSKAQGLGTLVPVNMKASVENALTVLEKKVGDLDDFVAKELGYESDADGMFFINKEGEKEAPFAAEQVDALALAIDNLKKGKGFIIGDQTGIGKGRVNAAIIRWAINNGHVPIFVTEKPNLYGDMFRDLTDIGMKGYLGHEPRILATNSNESIPLDEENTKILKTGNADKQREIMVAFMQAEPGKRDYDMVFTTYNQMQTVKGKESDRRDFLRNIVKNGILIFDESHGAGGQGKERAEGKAEDRAQLARTLVSESKGVFYSSATYAKRPDVMDLYAATDMVMAVAKPADLGEAIARGGVPMQQAVASMLAEAGQYIRRERSFAGIKYETPLIEVDRARYDQISIALADINRFSLLVAQAVETIKNQIKAGAEAVGYDNAVGTAGADSIVFTSVLHNLISTMLLSLKASGAAKMAISSLKSGEKPVITVANTVESFITQYATDVNISPDQAIDASFGDILIRYLDRTRTITIKKPFEEDPKKRKVKKYLTDEELGPVATRIYESAKQYIKSIDFENMPVSPIDALKNEIAAAGYSVGEITGRGTVIDYSGEKPIFRTRPGTEKTIKGRRGMIAKFNSGALDALVINQAGATGISLHASEKFKNQNPRHMILAQPEANIDTHMQMLGRVNRTGQMNKPRYSQLVADIPAEKRPAAVLAKKMASLNANTTASRGGALTAKDVPDFINMYGDQIAVTIMADDYDLFDKLGRPLKPKDNGALPAEDAMRKVTGRIPLLRLKEQEELYDTLEGEYAALLAQMDASGENALEAKTLDLKAETMATAEVVKQKDESGSPFAAPVVVEKVRVRRLGKPMSPVEIGERVVKEVKELGGTFTNEEKITADNAARIIEYAESVSERPFRNMIKESRDQFLQYKREILDDIESDERKAKEREKLDALQTRWERVVEHLYLGARITLKTDAGNMTGIVLKLDHKKGAKNPLALSSWKATFAIGDASRTIQLPLSRLFEDGKSKEDDGYAIEIQQVRYESYAKTLERFSAMQNDTHEDRYIATGNILAAYDWLSTRGQIINYTDSEGGVRQGIMTARNFDFSEYAASKANRIATAQGVIKWLEKNRGQLLQTADKNVSLELSRNDRLDIHVVAAKAKGGRYYLDKQITNVTGDFFKRGAFMEGDTRDGSKQVIERLMQLGAEFVAVDENTPKMQPVAPPKMEQVLHQPVTPKPIFYSAVQRVIESAKQEKASADQWLATVKNAKGVKQEEIDWLGLEDWLGRQTGSVTKSDLLGFIRANQIEIQEVMHSDNSDDIPGFKEKVDAEYERRLAAEAERIRDNRERSGWDDGVRSPDVVVEKYGEEGWSYTLDGDEASDRFATKEEAEEAAAAAAEQERELRQDIADDEREEDIWAKAEEYVDRVAIVAEFEGNLPQTYESYIEKGPHSGYRELLLTLPKREAERRPVEKLTALPEGYHSIFDGHAPGDRRWGVVPPNQTHARPINGGHPTEQAAIQDAIEHLNSVAEYRETDRQRGETGKLNYRSPHWGENNVLLHTRFTERRDAGKRILFVEEIQSDWHQEGRERGYAEKGKKITKYRLVNPQGSTISERIGFDHPGFLSQQAAEDMLASYRESWRYLQEDGTRTHSRARNFDHYGPPNEWKIESYEEAGEGVADAPFKTTWPELALKRLIRYAAEKGYDRIAWTPGALQNERYNLEKHIGAVRLQPVTVNSSIENTRFALEVMDPKGRRLISEQVRDQSDVAQYIGKELAEKLFVGENKERLDARVAARLEGLDLKTGGEGMIEFYDRMLPSKMNKIVKAFGAKVERGSFYLDKNDTSMVPNVPYVDITPEMRAGAAEGFTLFDSPKGSSSVEADKIRYLDQYLEQTPNRKRLENRLEAIINRILGHGRVQVAFSPYIYSDGKSHGWPDDMQSPDGHFSRGTYYFGGHHLIEIATGLRNSAEIASTAFHEAFHAAEDLLLTPREIEVFEREHSRLHAYIEPFLARHGYTREQMIDVGPYEVRAIAFQYYIEQKLGLHGAQQPRGIHIAVRRFFERLAQLIEQTLNAIRGLGFNTPETIFDQIFRGDMASRQTMQPSNFSPVVDIFSKNQPVGRMEQPMGPRRAPPVASYKKLPETWREAFERTDLPFRERMWMAIDAATLPLNRALGDKLVDLHRVILGAKAVVGNIGNSLDAYMNATVIQGRVEKRLKDFSERFLDAAGKMLADGITKADMSDYLYARHAAEANAQIANINPEMPDGGSGMTDAEAADIIQDFQNRGLIPALERHAASFDGFIQEIRDLYVRYGLESQETVDEWAAQYGFYVPLRGWADPLAGLDDQVGSGRGYDIRYGETWQRLGRKTKADNILVNIWQMAERAIIRGEKNRVGNAFLRFAQRYPHPDLYKINRAERKRRFNPETGLVEWYTSVPSHTSEDVFATKLGGTTYYIQIKHEGLLSALKAIGAYRLPAFFRYIGWVTRKMSMFHTAYNPDFLFTNLPRDIQEAAMVNLTAEKRKGLVKQFLKNVATLRPYIGVALYKAGVTTDRFQFGGIARFRRLADQWEQDGGQVAHYGLRHTDQLRRDLERELHKLGESGMKKAVMAPARAPGAILNALEFISNIFEAGTRIAAYDAALKVGLPRVVAAKISKEATVDFNKGGHLTPTFNSLYMFFNASARGSVQVINALRKSKTVRRIALGYIALGFLSTLWNMAMSGYDDEEDEKKKKSRYEKLKYWERERSYIFWLNDKDKSGYKIPILFGMKPFYMMGENAAWVFSGKLSPVEAAINIAGTIFNSYSPMQIQGSFSEAETWQRVIMPSITAPLHDLSHNKNWFGGKIHPDAMFWNKGIPDAERHFATSSPYAIATAQAINRLTGGDSLKSGMIDVHPDTLDYLANYSLGGLGAFVKRGVRLGQNLKDGIDTPVDQIPFLRIYRTSDTERATTSEFYEQSDAARQEANRLRQAKKNDEAGYNPADAERVLDRGGQIKAAEKAMERARKDLKKLSDEITTIRNDNNLSRADRQKRISEVQEEMRRRRKEAIKEKAEADAD